MNTETLPENWNEDIYEDVKAKPEELEALVVSSRDWTVETILSQIEQGNINLDPAFQRRNAWDDKKRSRLVESLITGLPVPEIVLAENQDKKRSFIVIDGKQRLLTVAGFIKPKTYGYWDKPILRGLTVRKDLNNINFSDLSENHPDEFRFFMNSSIRCTVISNFRSTDVLYDIFYRINTGSVSLSTQELRQVLNRGPFAEYLIQITNTLQPIHDVMGLDEPDRRLRDAEMILRFMSIELFGKAYRNNLRKFLDESMGKVNDNWEQFDNVVKKVYTDFNTSIGLLAEVLGSSKSVGRRYADGQFEPKFNKVLFEAEVYYFMKLAQIRGKITEDEKKEFIAGFQKLCQDSEFRSSIEFGTKDNIRYNLRFRKLKGVVNSAFRVKITEVPVPAQVSSKK